MIRVPDLLLKRYEAILKRREIPLGLFDHYRKWLRYFIDFSTRYPVPEDNSEQILQFLGKLREKKQPEALQRQAAHAVTLYFDLQKQHEDEIPVLTDGIDLKTVSRTDNIIRPFQYCEAGYQVKSDSAEWDEILEKLAAEIKLRHYSRKTLKTYAQWFRRFQHYLNSKPPAELSTTDVKDYLTYLAVKCHVAASTQNQAFNSLLFLYRHALKKDFGNLRDVPRAKKSHYIPMVLSRGEIDAILGNLPYPYDLAVKLLFGCGLRLFECLQLRVRDFNFETGKLTIHGKGKKDRTVPLPVTILPELKKQLQIVKGLHCEDLEAGYAGVFLDDAVERKYPKAPKELIH